MRVFDGIENVKERCSLWYSERLSQDEIGEMLRDDEKDKGLAVSFSEHEEQSDTAVSGPSSDPAPMPKGLELFVSEPIVDRKSVFVGRACRITDPSQVGPCKLCVILKFTVL